MTRALFLIAQENFRDEELQKPKKILEDGGVEVRVASVEKGEARGMFGLRVMPDLTVREANPNDYDALVIVGGSGSPKLADYPEVLDLVRRFNQQEKLIGAICLGPYILARAGILEGRKVTLFPSDFALAEVRRNGGEYLEEDVVVDGNLVTANGPQSAEKFGKKLLEKLKP